nr:hypothetical protein [Tanacetum cinerariifolium]
MQDSKSVLKNTYGSQAMDTTVVAELARKNGRQSICKKNDGAERRWSGLIVSMVMQLHYYVVVAPLPHLE